SSATPAATETGEPDGLATATVTATSTATPSPTETVGLPLDARLGNGMTVGQYLEQEAQRRLQFDREQEIASTRVTATPTPETTPEPASLEARGAFAPGMARISPSLGLSSFWKVMRYRDLIQQS